MKTATSQQAPRHGPKTPQLVANIIARWLPWLAVLFISGAAVLLFAAWEFCFPHIDEAHLSSPSDAAALTGMPLPAEATHIWTSSYRQGLMAFSSYVRFEAPVEVCKKYAAVIDGGQTLKDMGASKGNSAKGFDSDIFKNTSWFDLDQSSNLVGANGPYQTAPNVRVWVDQTRGVFYYRNTD